MVPSGRDKKNLPDQSETCPKLLIYTHWKALSGGTVTCMTKSGFNFKKVFLGKDTISEVRNIKTGHIY
jgi:hypothetical protein